MLNLGNYFVTTQGGFCPQIIKEYCKHFDHIDVFCLGNEGKQQFSKNVTVYSGGVLKWFSFFNQIEKETLQ